jgi:hypothetical protein
MYGMFSMSFEHKTAFKVPVGTNFVVETRKGLASGSDLGKIIGIRINNTAHRHS